MMITWRTAPLLRPQFARQGHRPADPVELTERRYGFLPARFRARGALHRIARIERIWEVAGRGGHADRRYFAVTCADRRCCTLFQDLRAGTWHVQW
ncbi:MAG: hypothetical protein HXY37_16980 [Chloroflexi bacterium]|nr:hypothetical protein [Chloroflexota bacterium]